MREARCYRRENRRLIKIFSFLNFLKEKFSRTSSKFVWKTAMQHFATKFSCKNFFLALEPRHFDGKYYANNMFERSICIIRALSEFSTLKMALNTCSESKMAFVKTGFTPLLRFGGHCSSPRYIEQNFQISIAIDALLAQKTFPMPCKHPHCALCSHLPILAKFHYSNLIGFAA